MKWFKCHWLLAACERARVETVKRAKALELNENDIALPNCDSTGDFEPIQCNPITGDCFCVDQTGFEIAGTRARSLDLVNCTSKCSTLFSWWTLINGFQPSADPKPCAGMLCRMLCPYEFELDEDGCPLCQCRDPCRGIKCPGSQTCQLEEVSCAKEPCPPIPTCTSYSHSSNSFE